MKVKELVCRDLLYLNLFIIKFTLLNVYCSKLLYPTPLKRVGAKHV